MRFRLRKGHSPLVSRLPARIIAATCVILVGMVILLAWSRESSNANERDVEEARLEAALKGQANRLLLATINQATKPVESISTEGTRPPDMASGGFGIIELPDGNRSLSASPELSEEFMATLAKPLERVIQGLSNSLRGSIKEPHEFSTRILPDSSTSGYSKIDGKLVAWALLPVRGQFASGAPYAIAIVHYEPVDTAFLTRLAVEAKTSFVKLDTSPATSAGVNSFVYTHANAPVYVSWKPDLPGDRMSNLLSAILTSIMALYTGLVAFYMTRRLAESETDNARIAAQDMLTGLANRLLFTIHLDDEIARTKRNHASFALFYLDFDRFKEVNDTYGHDGGDELIVSAARRIEKSLRQGDRLARFGGDEFAILQMDIGTFRDCEVLADRILANMREPFDIYGQKVYIGISIGITISSEGTQDRGELMRRADLALYRAKSQGRARFAFFDDAMNSELQRQKRLEDELRQAIKNDELEVNYQPIVASATQQLCGVEALVRWNNPERGVIHPQEFIAIAEERGLIVDLGNWVLQRACEDARHWPGIKLAVNVSAMQFRHKDFLDNIKLTLQETGFPPNRLELELTESVVIADADQAEAAIIELRAMGVRLALDDFGTGFSSLIYLRRFAIDKIKIDRSFVQMMESSNENAEIVRNIADLGRRLGLTVTAEGVEHEEQIARLVEFGCHELQGYLFGKPLTSLHIPALIASRKVRALVELKGTLAA